MVLEIIKKQRSSFETCIVVLLVSFVATMLSAMSQCGSLCYVNNKQ